MYIKIKNLINFLIFLILLPFINNKEIKPVPGSMLLIRLDAIGDYVLFRNFIKILKESKKYKNCKITLCGNTTWKELAENLDKDVVENFIWINRKDFYGNLIYKHKILKQIHNYGFETAIETTYSREVLFGDEIIKVSGATERIGNTGSIDKHSKWKRNLFSDKWYTMLIQSKENNVFEFYRNKEFFENLLGVKIDIKKPSIDVSEISFTKLSSKNYIVLFPGGSSEKRRWGINNFLEIAKYILDNSDYDIVIDGSKKEIKIAQYIWDNLRSQRVFVTAGSTSLVEMAKLLSTADLLLSNETSAVHFAAAVNTKFICISNGAFYNRFHPYPKEIFNDSYYIYPDEIMNNPDFNKDIYRFESSLDINQIKPEKVKEVLKNLIN